jgi:hypothetical protein
VIERWRGELQDLQVGDFIPDGRPATECGFVVEQQNFSDEGEHGCAGTEDVTGSNPVSPTSCCRPPSKRSRANINLALWNGGSRDVGGSCPAPPGP